MVKNPEELEARVVRAADAALERQQYVSTIDMLGSMGLLQPVHVDRWRKGRIDCLEQMIQGNPDKISFSTQTFHQWAQKKSLKPSETPYLRETRAGTMPLQFTRSGDPEIEKRYRTHYLSPAMPGAQTAAASREVRPGSGTRRIRDRARLPVLGMRNES